LAQFGTTISNTVNITGTVTDSFGNNASPTDTDSANYTGHTATLPGLTKGFWATHLTIWDVTTADDASGKQFGTGIAGTTDLDPTPKLNWDMTGSIVTDAVNTTGKGSAIGTVTGSGDSGLLLGDLNHDGWPAGNASDGTPHDTNALFFDLASAQALLNSSVTSDARIIMAGQALAAQLNEYNDIVNDGGPAHITSGFDASPTGLIEQAVAWLSGQAGPFGMPTAGQAGDSYGSKINFTTANDVPGIQTIINDGSGNDYTLSGGAITFKSTALSSSSPAWNTFVKVLNPYAPGTDSLGHTITSAFNQVNADGEGLKNALAAYDHGLSNSSTGGFVLSTDGSLIGWQDSTSGPVYDVHANTQGAFWGILEDQNLLHPGSIAGITGVHV